MPKLCRFSNGDFATIWNFNVLFSQPLLLSSFIVYLFSSLLSLFRLSSIHCSLCALFNRASLYWKLFFSFPTGAWLDKCGQHFFTILSYIWIWEYEWMNEWMLMYLTLACGTIRREFTYRDTFFNLLQEMLKSPLNRIVTLVYFHCIFMHSQKGFCWNNICWLSMFLFSRNINFVDFYIVMHS